MKPVAVTLPAVWSNLLFVLLNVSKHKMFWVVRRQEGIGCIDETLQHMAHCNKPSGCVCVCLCQKDRESTLCTCEHKYTHILHSLNIPLPFPVQCVSKRCCLPHQQPVCYFPPLIWTCQISHFTVSLDADPNAALRLLLCQLFQNNSGRVSRPLGSPENVLQRGVAVHDQKLSELLFCCLFTSDGHEEKLALGVATRCLWQLRLRNEDPAAWLLLGTAMWYKAWDSRYCFA